MSAEGTNTDASISIEMIYYLNSTIIVIKAVNTPCQNKSLIVKISVIIIYLSYTFNQMYAKI